MVEDIQEHWRQALVNEETAENQLIRPRLDSADPGDPVDPGA